MNSLVEIGLTNAILATGLAVIVALVTRLVRQPALVHALWLMVLLKLVTPPMFSIPWHWPSAASALNSPSASVAPSTPSIELTALASPAPSVSQDGVLTDSPPAEANADLLALETANAVTIPFSALAEELNHFDEVAVSPAADANSPAIEIVTPDPTVTFQFDAAMFSGVITSVWLAGSLIFLCVAAVRLVRFHRLLSRTAVPAGDDLANLATQVAVRIGVSRSIRLRVTEARLAPLVWPIGRSTILLSRPLVEELSTDELRTLLAHELAHLKRKDHWVRWFELAVTTLYWWHPVVWWARTQVHRAEERLCDAWTVWAFPDDVRRYATALFQAVQFTTENRRAVPIVASGLSAGGDLKERIEQIMNTSIHHRLSWPGLAAVMLAALIALPLSLRAQSTGDSSPAQDENSDAKKGDASATKNADTTENFRRPDGKIETRIRKVPLSYFRTSPQATDLASAQDSAIPVEQGTGQVASEPQPAEKQATATAAAPGAQAAAPGIRKSEESDRKIWEDQIRFLMLQLEKTDASFKAGTGSREDLELARYELARAQAEAAQADGRPEHALAKLEMAAVAANDEFQAMKTRHEAGQISAKLLYDAARRHFDARRRLLQARQESSSTINGALKRTFNDRTAGKSADRISPGDTIQLAVIGVTIDPTPVVGSTTTGGQFGGTYIVEPAGTIALGPGASGRVKVTEMPIDEAEKAIQAHYLGKYFKSVEVQVTVRKPAKRPAEPAELNNEESDRKIWQETTAGKRSDRIAPGDSIQIAVLAVTKDGTPISGGGTTSTAISGVYLVEPAGTVALGPAYGRLKVAESTFEEAERAIGALLAKDYKSVKVQVTVTNRAKRPAEPAELNKLTAGKSADRIAPGDAIQFAVTGANEFPFDSSISPGTPNVSTALVGPDGAIDLGPAYGRVKVAGLSMEEAQKAIQTLLEKNNKSVEVQVTVPKPAEFLYQAAGSHLQPALPPPPAMNRQLNTGLPDPVAAPPAQPAERFDFARELHQVSQSQSGDSISMLKAMLSVKRSDYEYAQKLAEDGLVSKSVLSAKRAEVEVLEARIRQTERALEYRKMLIALAENDLEQARAANAAARNSVSQGEIRRLQIMVELAKLKYAELAE